MRRKDREVSEHTELMGIIGRCEVCRIALNDVDGVPYILPLNFGVSDTDGQIRLYFHSALEGKKIDLMKRDNRVAFQMDTKGEVEYFEEKGYCTYTYESVMGKGRLRILADDEKAEALNLLMDHYHPGMAAYYNPAAIPRTCVYCLEVEEISGKVKLPHGR